MIVPQDFSLRILTPAAAAPMTLSQVKEHLKIADDLTDEDDLLGAYLASGTNALEEAFNFRFMVQQVELILQVFPNEDRIQIPLFPTQSVDYFTYKDTYGTVRSLTEEINYHTRLYRKPAELVLPWAQVWPPQVLRTADPIRIGLTVGFLRNDSPETLPIPPMSLAALRLLITHQYENRSAVTAGTLMKTDPLAIGIQHLMQNVRLF